MRVYLAGPWVDRRTVRQIAEQFEHAGHEITAHWIRRSDYDETPASLRAEALEDLEDIKRADVFVILNLSKSEGKATELGYVLAWNHWCGFDEKMIILVGPPTRNIFYHVPTVLQVDTVEAALGLIADPKDPT